MSRDPDVGGADARTVFSSAEAVDDYVAMTGLTPAEVAWFDRFVESGSRVLDLGVGAGRTTPRLSTGAARYVGLDIAEPMIAAARRLHPSAELVVGDATDLSGFGEAEFDLVVFSYNGIDYIDSDDGRRRCVAEVARVLRPAGRFLFSVHNPRAVLRRATRPITPRRAAVAAYQSGRLLCRVAIDPAARRGEGYVLDSIRGGLLTHMATPANVVAETEPFGFRHLATIGGDHPAPGRSWRTPWWYYAFERDDARPSRTSS